jgi:hypothetical protein
MQGHPEFLETIFDSEKIFEVPHGTTFRNRKTECLPAASRRPGPSITRLARDDDVRPAFRRRCSGAGLNRSDTNSGNRSDTNSSVRLCWAGSVCRPVCPTARGPDETHIHRARAGHSAQLMRWPFAGRSLSVFPPPWPVEEQSAGFVVRDHNELALVLSISRTSRGGDRR